MTEKKISSPRNRTASSQFQVRRLPSINVARMILFVWFYMLRNAVSADTEASVCKSEDGTCSANDENNPDPFDDCALWMAESSIPHAGLGAFAGKNFKAQDRVGPPDIMIPFFDHDKRYWSQWHDFVWNGDVSSTFYMENEFMVDAILPGLGAHVNCHMGLINIDTGIETKDSAGLHRSRDPMVGSFTYWHNYTKVAKRDIIPGEELFVSYGDHWFLERVDSMGHIPLGDDFAKADSIGGRLLDEKESLPAEVYDMLRNVSEPRLQNALPNSLPELERIFDTYKSNTTARASVPDSIRTPEWLKENGFCVDRLYVNHSTIPSAGRGAFSKIFFAKDEVISMSPVIHFKRPDLHSPLQLRDEDGVAYFTTEPGYKQLMTNYVFGNEDSDLVFVPYAPMVNLINHKSSKEANVAIRWASTSKFFKSDFLNMTTREVLEQAKVGLLIEYVALKDIQPGEELFMDYGSAWEEAHKDFLSKWKKNDDANYISAEDYNRAHIDEPIRTMVEQEQNPYPENLRTSCFYMDDREEDDDTPEDQWEMVDGEDGYLLRVIRTKWSTSMDKMCLRPCTVLKRETLPDGNEVYKAAMDSIINEAIPPYCTLTKTEKHIVSNIPRNSVQLSNQKYTSDFWLDNVFRHMIHAPEGMYPSKWKRRPRTVDDPGDFVIMDMDELRSPPSIYHLRWNDTKEVVSDYALEVAIPETVTNALLQYCERTGITAKFKELLLTPQGALEPGKDDFVQFGGMEWYIQRPETRWNSNMHWISPGGEEAHDDYLKALGDGGFDEVLNNIGKEMQLEGLVCYHVTFIGVSKCDRSYLHTDFTNTNGSGFNVIIPLIVASKTPPELYVRDDDEGLALKGGYKYRIGAASVIGDSAFHGTAEVDYFDQQEFRMAATIYMADVNDENVDEIMKDYTQHYPPSDADLLLSQAGKHWGKGQLPKGSKGLSYA